MRNTILKALSYLERVMPSYFPSVPRITGELLRIVTFLVVSRSNNATIVDIGAGYGYSTLWMYLGALEASENFKVVAIERSEERAKFLVRLNDKFGLEMKIVNDDAVNFFRRFDGQIHVAFIDIEKSLYSTVLRFIENRIVRGGVVMAHNVLGFRYVLKDFLDLIMDKQKWKTLIFSGDPEGLSISIRI